MTASTDVFLNCISLPYTAARCQEKTLSASEDIWKVMHYQKALRHRHQSLPHLHETMPHIHQTMPQVI